MLARITEYGPISYVIANLHPLTRQTIHDDTALERDSVSEPDHSCVAPCNTRRYEDTAQSLPQEHTLEVATYKPQQPPQGHRHQRTQRNLLIKRVFTSLDSANQPLKRAPQQVALPRDGQTLFQSRALPISPSPVSSPQRLLELRI